MVRARDRSGQSQTQAQAQRRHPPDVAAALRLLLFTGCRKGEVLGLRWAEVDFERGMLLLDDSKTG